MITRESYGHGEIRDTLSKFLALFFNVALGGAAAPLDPLETSLNGMDLSKDPSIC